MASLSSYYPQPVIAGTTAGTYAEGNDPRFGDGLEEAPEDGIIYGRKDADWIDITEPANLQVRRGTAAEVAAITPLEGEPVWETDTKKLKVGDSSTAGGIMVGPRLFGQPLSVAVIAGATTEIPASRSLFRRYESYGTSSTISFPSSGGQAGDFYIIVVQVFSGSPTVVLRYPTVNLGGGNFNYTTLATMTSGIHVFYVQHNANNTNWTIVPANLRTLNPVAINNAVDEPDAVTKLNALLAELRRLGIISGT
jgi:hypothetical protein